MTKIWKYFPGYNEAKEKILKQTMEQDLEIIDTLFGRDQLKFGDGATEVKKEALRQLEIEYRMERDLTAEFWVFAAKADKNNGR